MSAATHLQWVKKYAKKDRQLVNSIRREQVHRYSPSEVLVAFPNGDYPDELLKRGQLRPDESLEEQAIGLRTRPKWID